MNESFGKVVVLMGGATTESDVSLAALRRQGIDAHPFDPAERPIVELAAQGVDRAFIALHGGAGEDGTIQGVLEWFGIPYTGSGVLASALAANKVRAKQIWRAVGLPTPRFRVLDAHHDGASVLREIGPRLVVKPACEGSRNGITGPVTDTEALTIAYERAAQFDDVVFAEEFVSGTELACAILGAGDDARVLPLVLVETPEGISGSRRCSRSPLPLAREEAIQALALRAWRSLGCRGWGRADVLVDDEGHPYLIEVNTSPGMTEESLTPQAAGYAGMDYDALVIEILRFATKTSRPDRTAHGGR